jgi:hypothetical protein
MNRQELHRMKQIAGLISLHEGKYDQILWDMDKWLPADQELQDEYYEIKDPQELADWFENNADEGVLHQRGFRGTYLELAKADLASR